jgi:hypothetical protein
MKFVGGMGTKQKQSDLFSSLLNPAFANGSMFSQSLLNTLLASTYYNPFLVKLILKLVFPSDNRIVHYPLREYAGMSWPTVFEIFLRKGIPLGLYKHRDGTQKEHYVIVNPSPRTLVSHLDSVMMLIPLN